VFKFRLKFRTHRRGSVSYECPHSFLFIEQHVSHLHNLVSKGILHKCGVETDPASLFREAKNLPLELYSIQVISGELMVTEGPSDDTIVPPLSIKVYILRSS